MPVDANIIAENAVQTDRLTALVARLTDADLTRDLGDGWTVSVALAHAAFWDRRAVVVFERWSKYGIPYRDQDDDILNETLVYEWRAIPPRVAVEMAVAAARDIDAAVAALPEHVIEAVMGQGDSFLLTRSNHRREHIDQIEAVLP